MVYMDIWRSVRLVYNSRMLMFLGRMCHTITCMNRCRRCWCWCRYVRIGRWMPYMSNRMDMYSLCPYCHLDNNMAWMLLCYFPDKNLHCCIKVLLPGRFWVLMSPESIQQLNSANKKGKNMQKYGIFTNKKMLALTVPLHSA